MPASRSAAITGQFATETTAAGQWQRQSNHFTDRVTSDGSSGYAVEPGRYHLIVSLACPWAHRSVIVRRLLGLEEAISMTVVDPARDDLGWRFTLSPGDRDPVSGAAYLSELYLASDPDFRGRYTVPALWDRRTRRIITNDYPQLTLDLDVEWRSMQARGAPDLYPEHLRHEIDAMNATVYSDVNNGVYRCGFATDQEAYDTAYDRLFARLDALSEQLSTHRYLVGGQLTEADIRLFTTLVRFDAVYHGHFKCNRVKLTEMPVLWAYARDLFQTGSATGRIGDTVDFDQIKQHYYGTHDAINPTRIAPKGPATGAADPGSWQAPHGREALGSATGH